MSLSLLLATELRADVEAGYAVFGISAPGPFVAAIEALGVTHVPVPAFTRAWNPADDAAAARQLLAVLRRLDLDVLHTHTPKAGVLGRVLGRVAGVPVIVNTVHGLWAGRDDRLAKRALVYGAEAVAARFSHAELYQNDDDRRVLVWAVPRRRALTVGNGVDLARFRRDPAERARVRAEWGVTDDEVLVGGVGRRVAEKGIAEYAGAARALGAGDGRAPDDGEPQRLGGGAGPAPRDGGPRARFVWVGPDDPDKPDALRKAEEGVAFVGARDDMPAVYSALDVFALPSYREGFSRSAMEAAACGCALVLTDIRGCRELGVDGRDLLLVPPRSTDALTAALGRVIDDGSLRRRLAASAADRATRTFDQRRVAATSIAVYDAISRRRGSTR